MTTVKLRIRSDGSVTGLWSDAVDWQAIGRVDVRARFACRVLRPQADVVRAGRTAKQRVSVHAAARSAATLRQNPLLGEQSRRSACMGGCVLRT
jgi:hypothetical protein